jgi:hypothetical protein
MGDQRRIDSSHDVRPAPKAKAELDEPQDHDTKFGERQVQARSWNETPVIEGPDAYHKGIGDQTELPDKLQAAITAKNKQQIFDVLGKMNYESRKTAIEELGKMAPVLGGADTLRAADMCGAPLGATLDAALVASPKPTLHEMRAYLGIMHPSDLYMALYDDDRLAKVRAAYPGPAASLIPQITDDAAFRAPPLIRWYIETTPPATVAREMLSVASRSDVGWRGWCLNQIGRAGWLWVSHITDEMAVTAVPDVLGAYQSSAKDADTKEFLSKKFLVANGNKKPAPADDRREIIKGGNVDEIMSSSSAAGATKQDQITWLLEKPKLTIEEVRLALSQWNSETTGFTSASLEKLYRRFPDSTPADLFGAVPDQVFKLGAENKALRPWFVDKAVPQEILQFVTHDPNRITELCNWLVSRGTGYGWVYKLGGGRYDYLLRRFVLECPEQNVVGYVKTYILADHIKEAGTELTSAPIDKTAHQSSRATLDETLANRDDNKDKDAKQVGSDVDALSDDEVAALRNDTVKMKALLERATIETVSRLIHRVDPKLRDVFNFAPAGVALGLAEWVRTRPPAEVLEALGHQPAGARARTLMPAIGALELFPQLGVDTLLQQVLLRNPTIATWIIETSEPVFALTMLGSGACAAPAVKGLDAESVVRLPPGGILPARARDGLARLVQHSKGDLHDALSEKLSEKAAARDDADQAQANVQVLKDVEGKGLVAALTVAFEADPTPEVVLKICRAHVGEFDALMKQPELVAKVRNAIQLSPELVFPDVPLAAVMKSVAGTKWFFETTAPWAILHQCQELKMRTAIVGLLDDADDKKNDAARTWARAIPRGKALSVAEKAIVKAIAAEAKSKEARRLMFMARFDVRAEQEFDEKELDKLWATLERIPEAHISQGSVKNFTEFPGGGGTAGVYDEGTVTLADSAQMGQGFGQYDRVGQTKMTRDEIKKSLGLDDKMLEKWVADGRVFEDNGTFELVHRPETDTMTTTVLHEVGHAVDHMLGNHSELVFQLAGWRAHTEADFDQWATDLGGWSSVKAEDQKQIRDVWMMWMSSSRGDQAHESVGDMVADDHPAVAKRYAHVGVVQLAQKKSLAARRDPGIIGDKAAFVSHKQQRWYTMKVDGLRAAPSDYSLTAPGEYFAECYAFYYKDFDNTPQTADKKGVSLAPWIKTWFDKNIDNITHNPASKKK